VHGWIYGLHDGLLSDLNTTVSSQSEVLTGYEAALAALLRADAK
jgi:carbonic anhydrase